MSGTDVYERWEKSFLQNVKNHPTAGRAWGELCRCGIRDVALRLLADYAGVGPDVPPEPRAMSRNLAWLRLDCAVRAERAAQRRTRDVRASMFIARRNESRSAALDAPWLAEDPNVKTIRQALGRNRLSKDLSLRAVQWALKKAAGARGLVSSPMYFLFLLQGYAKKYGVQLGVKKLTHLTDCARFDGANPKLLDKGTLARFLRRIPFKRKILRETIPMLPPPARHL
jgi:hypothetical protein